MYSQLMKRHEKIGQGREKLSNLLAEKLISLDQYNRYLKELEKLVDPENHAVNTSSTQNITFLLFDVGKKYVETLKQMKSKLPTDHI